MQIGNKWNGWTIEKFIGEGSFGKVYSIVREEFGYRYESALKVIHIPQNSSEYETIKNEGMSDDSVTAYFKSMVEEIVEEFALMSKLKGNTNIVSYEDHAVVPMEDRFGWEIFIRMELLTPLYKYLKDNKLSIRQVIQLGIDICQALEVCQKYNIIHRDIKPENIFVSDIGKFKLGDFGIAKQLDKTLSGLSKKGTYTYMAPEVYKGMDYNSTVDIYSLGIVLYRFLNNNRTPFLPAYPQTIRYSDKEKANVLRMSGKPIPKPCNANGRLAEIVLKACAYEPSDRYESAIEFKNALQSILYSEKETPIIYPNGDILPNNESGTSKTDTKTDTVVSEEIEADKTAEGTVFLFHSEAEKAKRAAEEKARREAEEKARREAEEKARKEAEERARREAEERARREAEQRARREAAERARKEAEEKARREAEERARRQAEERAKKEAEERARLEAIERAKKAEEERKRREAEERERKKAEEKARIEAEKKAKKEAAEKAREEARRNALAEKAKKEAEKKARREAEAKIKREAEEKARIEAETRARKEAEEKAKRKAAEKSRKEAEVKAKREKAKKEKLESKKQQSKSIAEENKSNKGAVNTEKVNGKKKSKAIPIVIVSLIIVIGIIISAVVISNQGKTTVPSLKNLNQAKAEQILSENSLALKVSGEAYSDTIKKGNIISQSIKGGETVDKKTSISVVMSLGKAIKVPSVIGLSKKNAEEKMKQVGLKLVVSSSKYSKKVKKNSVISQNIKPGTVVGEGKTVKIVLSKGEKLYKVPYVLGDSESRAKAKIKKAKLKVRVKREYSDSVAKGKVVNQNRTALTYVKKNTVVTIIVSKGAKPNSTPSFNNEDTYNNDYSNNNQGANNNSNYQNNNQSSNNSVPDDNVNIDDIEVGE